MIFGGVWWVWEERKVGFVRKKERKCEESCMERIRLVILVKNINAGHSVGLFMVRHEVEFF